MSHQNSELLEALRKSFPEFFTAMVEDGQSVERLDLEQVRLLVGEGNYREKFGLRWENKPEKFEADSVGKLPSLTRIDSKRIHLSSSKPTHVLIEGDNYHALKVLSYTHEHSVDVIYIDPPYNTGKEFTYNDRIVDREDGYRHSKWLSFMAKRLRLAAALLKPTGILLLSIDDNEAAQLKLLCDEIFHEDNFIAQFIHKNNSNKNQAKLVGVSTEYVFCYAKSKSALKGVAWKSTKDGAADVVAVYRRLRKEGLSLDQISEEIKSMYRRPKYAHISRWNKVDEIGVFMDADLSRAEGRTDYTIVNPNTGGECLVPSRGWGKSLEELQRLQAEGLIYYGDGSTPPRMISYLTPDSEEVPDSLLFFDNSIDTREQSEMFGQLVFDYPKPRDMLKYLLGFVAPKDATILDFFAGSGTTAHAVLDLNKADQGTRKCILVTNDEGQFYTSNEEAKLRQKGWKSLLRTYVKNWNSDLSKSGLTKDQFAAAIEERTKKAWEEHMHDITLPGGICSNVTYPRLRNVIQGYTTKSGQQISGYEENLEFFQTTFLSMPKSRNQLRSFVRFSSELLCLKASCFTSVEADSRWALFKGNGKHLFVLFDEYAPDSAVIRLRDIDGPVEAYVFAYERDDDCAEVLSQLPNVSVQEVPQPLLDLFHRMKD